MCSYAVGRKLHEHIVTTKSSTGLLCGGERTYWGARLEGIYRGAILRRQYYRVCRVHASAEGTHSWVERILLKRCVLKDSRLQPALYSFTNAIGKHDCQVPKLLPVSALIK